MTTTQSRNETVNNERHNAALTTSKASVESPASTWVSNSGPKKNPGRPKRRKKAKSSSEKKDELHFYSPYIAKLLNPEQPDVTAAVLLTNLSMWQNSRYGVKVIDGRDYSYRSLNQLTEDCPYFKKTSIRKALERIENALNTEFIVKRDRHTLHFSIGPQTMKVLNARRISRKEKEDVKTMKFSFSPLDADITKSVRSAVLLGNLKHQITEFVEPLKDENGNRYGELRPSVLEPILGFSRDTIARTLDDLSTCGLIVQHLYEPTFYRLGHASDAEKWGHNSSAEVNRSSAGVHTTSAEVHTNAAKVHTKVTSNEPQMIDAQGILDEIGVGYINECINAGINECIKDRDLTSSAALARHESKMSKGLMMLQELAEVKLAKLRSENKRINNRQIINPDHTPYDVIDPYELAYEVVSEDQRTFFADLDSDIRDLKGYFKEDGQKVTQDDESKIRRFLIDNPKISYVDLWDLYGKVIHRPLVFTGLKSQATHPIGLLTKVKTPKQFLKYLPQILVLLNWDGEEEWSEVRIEEPFNDLNYAYLGKAPNSSIVFLDDGTVPPEVIEG